jgi:hypothetical protein
VNGLLWYGLRKQQLRFQKHLPTLVVTSRFDVLQHIVEYNFFALVPYFVCIVHFETSRIDFELLFLYQYAIQMFSLNATENCRSRKVSKKQKRMAASGEERCPHAQEATVSGTSNGRKYMKLRRLR